MQHSHGHIQDTEELKTRQSNCWLWLVRSGLYEFPSLLLSSLIPVLKVVKCLQYSHVYRIRQKKANSSTLRHTARIYYRKVNLHINHVLEDL